MSNIGPRIRARQLVPRAPVASLSLGSGLNPLIIRVRQFAAPLRSSSRIKLTSISTQTGKSHHETS
jgi:hypothetical protein